MLNQPCVDSFDYVIIGAGIVGLSLAKALLEDEPALRIAVIEKEKEVGLHASGRNSGVLHSGIYYPPLSLKAKFCREGSRLMRAYCEEHALPCSQTGKLIIPDHLSQQATLELLEQRGLTNGVSLRRINEQELKDLEPKVQSATGQALYVPETAVVDSMTVMQHLYQSLLKNGIKFYYNQYVNSVNVERKLLKLKEKSLAYGHLFNAAGLFADKLAMACGLESDYEMLPIKGYYFELDRESDLALNHLIYPVPDLNVPFLGVHFTKSVFGQIYIGPTAIPALGREHYRGLTGIKLLDCLQILKGLGKQYYFNKQGFRTYVHRELPRLFKSEFIKSAQRLVPGLQKSDLKASKKVGIRAQLYDKVKNELVSDFLIKHTKHETHILNAVSPAFSSAFSFAKWVIHER